VKSETGDYRAYYTNIYDVIVNNEALIVTPEQAKNTIKIIEYAMESNEKKRTIPISL
jgi:predicted dehydrogenase